MKNKNKKPLKKYQSGGWGDFPGSNLFNPSASDVNMGLFGRGFLDIANVPNQYMNLGDNPFGTQLMSGTAKSAQLLGTIPGVSEMGDTMPEWGGEYAQKMKQDIAKEKGLKYNEWSGKWKNDKGEVYTNKELEDLAGQRYDTQKSQREQLRKFQPMLAPLLQLNELGEMQKTSYRQGQKSDFYDVTNKPMGMETRGFFAKEGMRTPPVTEVYRMMGAHQGLPQTSSRLATLLKSELQRPSNYITNMEEGGKPMEERQLSSQEISVFNDTKQKFSDYINSPMWEDRYVKMQLMGMDYNPQKEEKIIRELRDEAKDTRSAILGDLNRATPVVVPGRVVQNQAGMFDPETGKIYVNEQYYNPEGLFNTLLHELGHSATFSSIPAAEKYVSKYMQDIEEVPVEYKQRFYTDPKGRDITSSQYTQTVESETGAVVNTLRGIADQMGLVPFGSDITPEAFNALKRQAMSPSSQGETQQQKRDRDFLRSQFDYLRSMYGDDDSILLQTLNTIAAADTKGQAPYYNAKNGGSILNLIKAQNGLEINQEELAQRKQQEAVDYYNKWRNSPIGSSMLKKSTGSENEYNKYYQGRGESLKNLPNVKFIEEQAYHPNKLPKSGFYQHHSGSPNLVKSWGITLYPYGVESPTTVVHETGHAEDQTGKFIPENDKKLINSFRPKNFDKSPLGSSDSAKNMSKKEKQDEWKYMQTYGNPKEVRQLLNQIRYSETVDKNPLYDPYTQKVTPDIFEGMKNKVYENTEKNPLDILRKNFTDDQIIELLNTISYKENNKNSDIQMAQQGGGITNNELSRQTEESKQWISDYINSPDVRKRLFNQIKKYNKDIDPNDTEAINELVDERLSQYGSNIEDVKTKLYIPNNNTDFPYYNIEYHNINIPKNNKKGGLKNTLLHELRHSMDNFRDVYGDVSRIPEDEIKNVELDPNLRYRQINRPFFYKQSQIDKYEKTAGPNEEKKWGVSYFKETPEKTARLMELRSTFDKLGWHKGGQNISRKDFDKYIKKLDEEFDWESEEAAPYIELKEEANLSDDDIFRLWNETVNIQNKNNYGKEIENMENPTVAAKQGGSIKNKKQYNMYNNQKFSRLALLLGGGLINESMYSSYADGGKSKKAKSAAQQFREYNDSLPVQALKMADPTGISAYPDVYFAGKDFVENPSWGGAANVGLNVLGALPAVGYLGRGAKLARAIDNSANAAKNINITRTAQSSLGSKYENNPSMPRQDYYTTQIDSSRPFILAPVRPRMMQEGGMQQPMSEEEAIMQEQMMQEAMMQQQMAQDPRMQEQMAQEQMAQQQMGQQQTAQPQQPGQNKYMQLPQEQQVEVYKMLIDYIMINGIDALEQQFPEEYQFFEEFSDQIEGEQEEGGEEEGMETEANRMEMGGEEEMYSEEEAQSEFPTDEEELPVGARPGENAMRPAEPMEGAQQMKQGGIPERYRKMGFNKVGQKRQSDRPGKKWAVLAKKGDQYKIVHGGAKGMEDFKQHGSKDRQKRFWDRMGGKDSAKARDPFSPLYWHKRFGTW